MSWMVLGLALFLICHLAALTPAVRAAAVARLGAAGWGGVMTLCAGGGLALVGIGWSGAPNDLLFAPWPAAIRFAPVLVSLALVLFFIGGLGFNGHIRHRLRHPMLMGAALWAATHLLANGGLRETLLFGFFLGFSLFALAVLFARGKRPQFVPDWRKDVLGVIVGLVIAKLALLGHAWAFGVPAYLPQ